MVYSLSQAITAYQAIAGSEGKSPRTIEWVEASADLLRRFLGADAALASIAQDDVRRWVLAMRQRGCWAGRPQARSKPLSATSINNYVRGVKLLFATLAREGLIPPHPVSSLKAPKASTTAVKPYSDAELRRIFQALAGTAHPLRNRAVVGLLFDPGLRLSEAVGLQVEDLDLPGRRIVVRGKGNKERVLPLSAWATRLLLNYLAKERRDGGVPCVFVEDDGQPLTHHAVQQVLRRLARKLHFRLHAHRFRHSGAIEYLRSGGDSLLLQQLLGHSSLNMTKRYAAIAGADLQASPKLGSVSICMRMPIGLALASLGH